MVFWHDKKIEHIIGIRLGILYAVSLQVLSIVPNALNRSNINNKLKSYCTMDESDSDLIHCQRTYWIHPTDIDACIVSVQKLLLKKNSTECGNKNRTSSISFFVNTTLHFCEFV